jgi:ribosomal protein S18 acetylase RimI-like enzyme
MIQILGMPSSALNLVVARNSDVPEIVALVESVYRGEHSKKGWTTEAHVLDGRRTDDEMIRELLRPPESLFLLLRQEGRLLASVHLERKPNFAYLGMLSVDVSLQNQKIGKKILDYAETFAKTEWKLNEMRISVLHLREELISWYRRRGFELTGEFIPFPQDPRFGKPKVPDLKLMEMKKLL